MVVPDSRACSKSKAIQPILRLTWSASLDAMNASSDTAGTAAETEVTNSARKKSNRGNHEYPWNVSCLTPATEVSALNCTDCAIWNICSDACNDNQIATTRTNQETLDDEQNQSSKCSQLRVNWDRQISNRGNHEYPWNVSCLTPATEVSALNCTDCAIWNICSDACNDNQIATTRTNQETLDDEQNQSSKCSQLRVNWDRQIPS